MMKKDLGTRVSPTETRPPTETGPVATTRENYRVSLAAAPCEGSSATPLVSIQRIEVVVHGIVQRDRASLAAPGFLTNRVR